MLPPNRVREVTVHPLYRFVHSYMYSFLCCVAPYVHIVHSTWTDTICRCSPLRQEMGTQKVPFYAALRGILPLDDWRRTRAGGIPFGPRVHLVKNLYIFTHDHLWLVIVILKSLNLVVSSIHVLYYLYLHILNAF